MITGPLVSLFRRDQRDQIPQRGENGRDFYNPNEQNFNYEPGQQGVELDTNADYNQSNQNIYNS